MSIVAFFDVLVLDQVDNAEPIAGLQQSRTQDKSYSVRLLANHVWEILAEFLNPSNETTVRGSMSV